ncbi:MAG TPA: ABC transporter substrate-binding protein/permease [Pirellulales bacterium]|jgi:polar amino acid transport system substrate-binding protein
MPGDSGKRGCCRFSRLLVLFLSTLLVGITCQAWAADDAEAVNARLRERLADGVLHWGGDAEGGAPYQLRDPKDPARVIGFEVDLADALAEVLTRRLGKPITAEFVQYQWESLELGLLISKDFDCIISGYEITPVRKQAMLFTRPYYVYAEQLVVRHDDRRIHNLEDCRNFAVGTLAGSAAERLLNETGVREVVAFDGQVEPYLDLELGRLDAVLLDSIIALYYASSNAKLQYAGEPSHPGVYAIACRPEDADLSQALDEGLAELIRNGRLQTILRRWHLWNRDQAALAEGPNVVEHLRGMGFDADRQPLDPDAPAPADAVDIHVIAASAQMWTLDEYGRQLVKAAGMTVFLTVCSMATAVVLALPICLLRLYGPKLGQWFALGYVEFFRGIPLLLLLFVLYFGLPHYGIHLDAIGTAILGFGLNYAAYEAEIYRSAITSVPVGQWEAGRALGMTEATTFRRIIMPQALQTALGPMTNDFVALFKDTSLVSVIAVRELTKEYMILSRSSLKFFELGLLTAVLYLCMSVPLGYLSRYLERRFKSVR